MIAQRRTGRTALRNGVLFAAGVLAAVFAVPCDAEEKQMVYRVARVQPTVAFDSNWDGEFWRSVEPLELKNFMGARPAHFPKVQAKLAYDDAAVYVIFRVADRYVRAVAREHQDAVYRDSCVEFFFTPGEDVGQGYFNLEMNCGGTMLLHFQRTPRQDNVLLAKTDLAQIDVEHSLPTVVDPEITDPTQWIVAYRLPVDLFSKYVAGTIQQPASGVTWRANLYKCADDTSHPHWLTWSPVEFERPDFHRPQSFGVLMFE